MFVLLLLVVGVVGFVALVVTLGACMPRDHVASSSVRVAAAPEAVWALVADGATWPAWCEGVTSMERLPDREGRAVWKMATRQGALVTEVVSAEPPRRYVTRIADDTLPFGGVWIWAIEPEEAGERAAVSDAPPGAAFDAASGASAVASRVTLTEEGFVRNVAFRAIGGLVFGWHRTIETTLRSLARRFGDAQPKVERVR